MVTAYSYWNIYNNNNNNGGVRVITTFVRQTRRVGVRCDIQRAQRRPIKHRETRWLRTRKLRSLLPVISSSVCLSTSVSFRPVRRRFCRRRCFFPSPVVGRRARTIRRRHYRLFLFPRDVNYFIRAVPPPSFHEWGQA